MNGNKTAQSQKMRPMHGMAGWIFHRFRALHFAYVASQVQDLHDLERLESKRKRKRTPLEIVHDLKFGWYCTYCHYISFLSIELICFPGKLQMQQIQRQYTECTQLFASVATKVNRQRPASWLRCWPPNQMWLGQCSHEAKRLQRREKFPAGLIAMTMDMAVWVRLKHCSLVLKKDCVHAMIVTTHQRSMFPVTVTSRN